MRAWLRRNAVALIAIPVLLLAFGWAVAKPQYRTYWTAVHPGPDQVVARGHGADIDGSRWEVIDVSREHRGNVGAEYDVPLPDGLEAVRVLWRGQPVPSLVGCDETLIAGETRWKARKSYGSQPDISVASGGPADATPVCSDTESSMFQAAFLVPAGTEPDAVELGLRLTGPEQSSGETTRQLRVRFQLAQ